MIDIYPAVIRLSSLDAFEDIFEFTPSSPAPEGTRKVDRCRVAVVNNFLMVATDSPSGILVVFKEKATRVEQIGEVFWVTTETGKLAVVEGNDNCDCASRLELWNPTASAQSADSERG